MLLPSSLALLLAGAPAPAQQSCATVVPAGSVTGQTWTLAGSPYCVTGDLQVDGLTIEAGVQVLVDGAYRIEVVSTLTVQGTCREPVTFAPRDAATRWEGFHLEGTGPGSSFQHAIVTGVGTSAFTLTDCVAPLFEDCVFHANRNAGNGGAILATGLVSDLSIERCAFTDNQAYSGGAIDVSFQDGFGLVLLDSSFEDNRAVGAPVGTPAEAGAVYLRSGGHLVKGCTFRNNRVTSVFAFGLGGSTSGPLARGGALFLEGAGAASVEDCLFSRNWVNASITPPICLQPEESYGGAVYVDGPALRLESSILAGNLAQSPNHCGEAILAGGGLYATSTSVDIVNCTVVRNSSTGAEHGGGGGLLRIKNSILYLNNGSGPELSGLAQVSYSCVQGGVGGTGNLFLDPQFLGTGNEADDQRVAESSPTLDAGNPDPLFEDGCAPPGKSGARNDMGAFGGPGNCAWGCAASARAVSRNGSGTNDEILRSLSAPVPGRCWTVALDCTGSTPSVAYLQVKRFPTSGVFTLGQEVLIAGPQFLALQRMHAGDTVRFTGPVPSAAVLCGFSVSAQGACFGGGFRLSNALDLTLGR